MTHLARLKDVFLDRAPDRTFACTYGFQPEFFEQEILPSMLPGLALDRGAGNTASYLHAGDEILRGHPVVVCCDHYESGRQLPYNLIRVRARFAFHPKLLLLDYGDRMRAVVSSANLTRHGWSSAFELFVFEDLQPGKSHAWGEPLAGFVRGVRRLLGGEDALQLDQFIDRIALVKRRRVRDGDSRLVSTFEGKLIDAVDDACKGPNRVDVVTPFLEGDEGAGVFDELAKRCPGATGTLYVRAEDADGSPIVRGPKEKLDQLLAQDEWSLRRVELTWDGDEEDAPPRPLHGKLLTLRRGSKGAALVGSANVTRAALLGKYPNANVELGVVVLGGSRLLDGLLPQSEPFPGDEVEILPAEKKAEEVETPADWIESAIYRAGTSSLELKIKQGSPPVDALYGERVLATKVTGPAWSSELKLGQSLEVLVRSRDSEALVPFLVLDLELLDPRGMSRQPTLDELLDIMSGAREAIDSEGGDPPIGPNGPPGRDNPGAPFLQGESAFAWRRLMRGLAGLERDLVAALPFEIEARRLLDGPLGARALLEALKDLADHWEGFVEADFAFALHQVRCTLVRARQEAAKSRRTSKEALSELDRWIARLKRDFNERLGNADASLAKQMRVLRNEAAARA